MKIRCNCNDNNEIIELSKPKREGIVVKCNKCNINLAMSMNNPLTTFGLEWRILNNRYDHIKKKVLVVKVH